MKCLSFEDFLKQCKPSFIPMIISVDDGELTASITVGGKKTRFIVEKNYIRTPNAPALIPGT